MIKILEEVNWQVHPSELIVIYETGGIIAAAKHRA